MSLITNFGQNLSFRPSACYLPRSEHELLGILENHRGKKIRAIGRLHSWSEAPRADEVSIDLRYLNHVCVDRNSNPPCADIGAGCQIKRVLTELERHAHVTLPSVGLITEQTIAGAIATGTHGSGRHSLSHYVSELRLATYDAETGKPTIRTVCSGLDLLAARCSLGCLGVIVSVKMPCRNSYLVEEHLRRYSTLDEVLDAETQYPLQQFFFIPWLWRFIAQHRRETTSRRSWYAPVYRTYWLLAVDVALHLWILFMARWLRSARMVRFYYRWIFPQVAVYRWKVVDNSQQALTMKHELFRHIEIETFVSRTRLAEALDFVREVLTCFDNRTAALSQRWKERLERIGLMDALRQNAGTYTHHYPICIRRVLVDDTLISMSSGDQDTDDCWYALSFISYARVNDRTGFLAFSEFLGKSMAALFGARPHWGKLFPVEPEMTRRLYPRWTEFGRVCAEFDRTNAFSNRWTQSLLGD
jgi:hypothetical protein